MITRRSLFCAAWGCLHRQTWGEICCRDRHGILDLVLVVHWAGTYCGIWLLVLNRQETADCEVEVTEEVFIDRPAQCSIQYIEMEWGISILLLDVNFHLRYFHTTIYRWRYSEKWTVGHYVVYQIQALAICVCMWNLTSHSMTFDLDCWFAVAGSHMVCASESFAAQGPLCFLSRSLWQFSGHLLPFLLEQAFHQAYCVTVSCSNMGTLRWLTVFAAFVHSASVQDYAWEKNVLFRIFTAVSNELDKARKELKRMSEVTSQPLTSVLKNIIRF